ncbi:olfactory receptor 8G50-like [Cavia porcellus]|uniref:olfactory receptor 8G50-like n=1 Tax=Cavia porcellus TaxID=10141 RepID=UPI002FE238C9
MTGCGCILSVPLIFEPSQRFARRQRRHLQVASSYSLTLSVTVILGVQHRECHVLAAMVYDHYVAICSPLLFNVTMSSRVCCWIVVGVSSMGFIGATAHTVCMLRVIFCKAEVINHYFCDLFPLLELSCSSTLINERVVLCLSAFNILLPALTILSSYIFIIASILRIRSTAGKSKAFSTCSSHLSAVAVFFGSAPFMYLQPSSVSSMNQAKLSSLFYATLLPILNPLIYSLRNKDAKGALKKFFLKIKLRKTIFTLSSTALTVRSSVSLPRLLAGPQLVSNSVNLPILNQTSGF